MRPMTLKDQAIWTANALNNMANDMECGSHEIPVRYITACRQQAEDLMKAARSDSGQTGRVSRADGGFNTDGVSPR